MTDKEQIMINDVDVSECIHLYSRWPGSIPPDSCACWEEPNDLTDTPVTDCKRHENCYFKQLARKTQECEELKAEEKYLKQCCQKAGEELAKHSFEYDGKEKNLVVQAIELNEKYEKLEKALEGIKRICLEDTYTFTDGTTIRYDTLDDILDIINREEGEENE